MKRPLHPIYWLWIPIAFLALQLVGEEVLHGKVMAQMLTENGLHELLQFCIMVICLGLAVRLLARKPWKISPWLGVWVGLAAVCSLYVAGEEVSWGQHFFDWSSNEFWQEVNDQNETNLHNTSSWFDQKPRSILLFGSLFGTIVIPVIYRLRPKLEPPRWAIIYPPAVLAVVACLALGINLIDKVYEHAYNNPFFHRGSEIEELYLYYFILLYLMDLRRRVLAQLPTPAAEPDSPSQQTLATG